MIRVYLFKKATQYLTLYFNELTERLGHSIWTRAARTGLQRAVNNEVHRTRKVFDRHSSSKTRPPPVDRNHTTQQRNGSRPEKCAVLDGADLHFVC